MMEKVKNFDASTSRQPKRRSRVRVDAYYRLVWEDSRRLPQEEIDDYDDEERSFDDSDITGKC